MPQAQGHQAMGRVSIWKQWLIIAAGVVVCPELLLLATWLMGWLLFRRLWLRLEVAVGRHIGRLGRPLRLHKGDLGDNQRIRVTFVEAIGAYDAALKACAVA
jgi:hypothetical protein